MTQIIDQEWQTAVQNADANGMQDLLSDVKDYTKRIHWWVRLFGVAWLASIVIGVIFGIVVATQLATDESSDSPASSPSPSPSSRSSVSPESAGSYSACLVGGYANSTCERIYGN